MKKIAMLFGALLLASQAGAGWVGAWDSMDKGVLRVRFKKTYTDESKTQFVVDRNTISVELCNFMDKTDRSPLLRCELIKTRSRFGTWVTELLDNGAMVLSGTIQLLPMGLGGGLKLLALTSESAYATLGARAITAAAGSTLAYGSAGLVNRVGSDGSETEPGRTFFFESLNVVRMKAFSDVYDSDWLESDSAYIAFPEDTLEEVLNEI